MAGKYVNISIDVIASFLRRYLDWVERVVIDNVGWAC